MWESNLILSCTVLIVIFIFKNEIKVLISAFSKKGEMRINGILNLKISSDTPNILTKSQDAPDTTYIDFHKSFENPVIFSKEKAIKSELIRANLTYDQAVDALIYHLANTQLIASMLIIDKQIFEEQIKLLLYLNTQNIPRNESDLLCFYNEWKDKNSDKEYSFNGFLGFLLQQNLIIKNNYGYTLEPIGKEYLQFLIRVSKPLPTQ